MAEHIDGQKWSALVEKELRGRGPIAAAEQPLLDSGLVFGEPGEVGIEVVFTEGSSPRISQAAWLAANRTALRREP